MNVLFTLGWAEIDSAAIHKTSNVFEEAKFFSVAGIIAVASNFIVALAIRRAKEIESS